MYLDFILKHNGMPYSRRNSKLLITIIAATTTDISREREREKKNKICKGHNACEYIVNYVNVVYFVFLRVQADIHPAS